jgi:hypothetical protein
MLTMKEFHMKKAGKNAPERGRLHQQHLEESV